MDTKIAMQQQQQQQQQVPAYANQVLPAAGQMQAPVLNYAMMAQPQPQTVQIVPSVPNHAIINTAAAGNSSIICKSPKKKGCCKKYPYLIAFGIIVLMGAIAGIGYGIWWAVEKNGGRNHMQNYLEDLGIEWTGDGDWSDYDWDNMNWSEFDFSNLDFSNFDISALDPNMMADWFGADMSNLDFGSFDMTSLGALADYDWSNVDWSDWENSDWYNDLVSNNDWSQWGRK